MAVMTSMTLITLATQMAIAANSHSPHNPYKFNDPRPTGGHEFGAVYLRLCGNHLPSTSTHIHTHVQMHRSPTLTHYKYTHSHMPTRTGYRLSRHLPEQGAVQNLPSFSHRILHSQGACVRAYACGEKGGVAVNLHAPQALNDIHQSEERARKVHEYFVILCVSQNTMPSPSGTALCSNSIFTPVLAL